MTVSIKIVPSQNSLHMFGEPDRLSAYSLSGNVEITLSPHFLSRRTAKVLLQSLELTFEGQSEVSAPGIGQTDLRLFTSTTELVQNEPILLSDDGDESSCEPCRWNVVFNINVPGWLPASSAFGVDKLGVSYHLYATAKYVDVESRKRDSSSSGWSLSSLCSAIYSGPRISTAAKTITVKRFSALPCEDEPKPVPDITFLLNHVKARAPSEPPHEPHIPEEVLSKLRILVSVPEYYNVDDKKVSMTLRLRTKDLAVEECQLLQLKGFRVDIMQKDKWRAEPTREYLARFPIPPEECQPPNVPLRWTSRSPFSAQYMLNGESDASCSRTFTLLPPTEDGRYTLQGNNYVFAKDAEPSDKPMWYTLQTNIPIVDCAPRDCEEEWAGPPKLRPSTYGPLFAVRHEIKVSLHLSYDLPGSNQKAQETLAFNIPVRFGLPPPHVSRPKFTPSSNLTSLSCSHLYSPSFSASMLGDGSSLDIPGNFTITPSPILPPYSQFYHFNGDRKIDPTPLPRYTPRGVTIAELENEEQNSLSLDSSANVVSAVPSFSRKLCDEVVA